MANKGAWTNTPTSSGKVTIPAGYHNGNGYVDTTSVYNAGVTDADARTNTSSANYTAGYNAGVAAGSALNVDVLVEGNGYSITYTTTKKYKMVIAMLAGGRQNSSFSAAFTCDSFTFTTKLLYNNTDYVDHCLLIAYAKDVPSGTTFKLGANSNAVVGNYYAIGLY